MIDAGFPADHIVLRCDPIIPTEDGLTRLKNVLDTFVSMNTGITRVRFSIYDEYNHVKARLANVGMKPIYDGSFYTPKEMMENTAKLLASYPDLQFESCAEDELVKTVNLPNIKCCGCVSLNEIKLFGINDDVSKLLENMQNRHGCHCLSCKTELLNERKQCPHKCIYCYWKN